MVYSLALSLKCSTRPFGMICIMAGFAEWYVVLHVVEEASVCGALECSKVGGIAACMVGSKKQPHG